MQNEWRVTRMQREHLPHVAALETVCFSEPWSETALELLLGETAVGIVALDGEGIPVGYGSMMQALDEGQIINVAVHPKHRRKGIGAAIVAALIEEGEGRGLCELSLEVRASNEAAIGLYEAFGFSVEGVRKRFYRHPAEDGLVMARRNYSKEAGTEKC